MYLKAQSLISNDIDWHSCDFKVDWSTCHKLNYAVNNSITQWLACLLQVKSCSFVPSLVLSVQAQRRFYNKPKITIWTDFYPVSTCWDPTDSKTSPSWPKSDGIEHCIVEYCFQLKVNRLVLVINCLDFPNAD